MVGRGISSFSTIGESPFQNRVVAVAQNFSLTMRDRSTDDAKIKQKMLFASSRDALRRSLVGIATEIQGTDYSEVDHEVGA